MRSTLHCIARPARFLTLASAFAFAGGTAPVFAGPGAHGPNGEHLDAPAATTPTGNTHPRIEAHSELFELAGSLRPGEFSVMINRYETNAPVLDATVEVASGPRKASAKFHADRGDYAVDDPALLESLSTPGEHAVLFTIVAGGDSDLLDGTLSVSAAHAPAAAHGHSHALEYALAGAGIAAILAFGALVLRRRRRLAPPRAGGVS